MGSSYSEQLSDEKMKEAEKKLLSYTGLDEDMLEIKKIFIDEDREMYMTTTCVGDPDNDPLVMIHGYGGSGALFYRAMAGLAKNFYCIIIDIIGMGTSSRPDWTITDNELADDFFMTALENWRIANDNLTNFYLAAHSYGAYLAGTYACKHPHHVRKLLLLSPLGVKLAPVPFDITHMDFPKNAGPPKWARWWSKALWGTFTPFSLLKMRSVDGIRSSLTAYIAKHQPVENEEEHEALLQYLFQILLRKESTERAFFIQFDAGMHAKKPLLTEEKLLNSDLPFPISFIYGSKDWMDSRGSREIVRNNKFFASGESQLHVLKNAGHQLFMTCPDGFVELVTDDLLGRKTFNFHLRKFTVNYYDANGNPIMVDEEFDQWKREKRQKKLEQQLEQ